MSRHIRDAELTADVGTEVSFLLPKSNTPQFPGLFEELDDNQSALGFESYGVSVTTLEDVSPAVSRPFRIKTTKVSATTSSMRLAHQNCILLSQSRSS